MKPREPTDMGPKQLTRVSRDTPPGTAVLVHRSWHIEVGVLECPPDNTETLRHATCKVSGKWFEAMEVFLMPPAPPPEGIRQVVDAACALHELWATCWRRAMCWRLFAVHR